MSGNERTGAFENGRRVPSASLCWCGCFGFLMLSDLTSLSQQQTTFKLDQIYVLNGNSLEKGLATNIASPLLGASVPLHAVP